MVLSDHENASRPAWFARLTWAGFLIIGWMIVAALVVVVMVRLHLPLGVSEHLNVELATGEITMIRPTLTVGKLAAYLAGLLVFTIVYFGWMLRGHRRIYLPAVLIWFGVLLLADIVMVGTGHLQIRAAERRWIQTYGSMNPRDGLAVVAPEHNASHALLEAVKLFPELTDEQISILALHNHNPYSFEQLESVLELLEPFLREVHAAAEMPAFAYPVEGFEARSESIMHTTHAVHALGVYRKVSRALDLQVQVAHLRGDHEQTAQIIRTGMILSQKMIQADKVMIHYLVANSNQQSAISAIQRIYDEGQPVPDDFIALLRAVDHRAELIDALQRDVPQSGEHMRTLDTVPGYQFVTRWTGLRDCGDAAFLNMNLRNMDLLAQQPYRRTQSLDTGDKTLSLRWTYPYNLDPEEIDGIAQRYQARIVQAELAIRLRTYKLEHGQYPSTLSALGSVPDDPVTGQPMRYELDANGFVLHSGASCGTVDPTCAWRWSQ